VVFTYNRAPSLECYDTENDTNKQKGLHLNIVQHDAPCKLGNPILRLGIRRPLLLIPWLCHTTHGYHTVAIKFYAN